VDINVKNITYWVSVTITGRDGATQPWCWLAQQNLNKREGEDQKMQEEREKEKEKEKLIKEKRRKERKIRWRTESKIIKG
jgi:hypothetical protein